MLSAASTKAWLLVAGRCLLLGEIPCSNVATALDGDVSDDPERCCCCGERYGEPGSMCDCGWKCWWWCVLWLPNGEWYSK